MATNQWAHVVVMCALSVVDDTALLGKAVVAELQVRCRGGGSGAGWGWGCDSCCWSAACRGLLSAAVSAAVLSHPNAFVLRLVSIAAGLNAMPWRVARTCCEGWRVACTWMWGAGLACLESESDSSLALLWSCSRLGLPFCDDTAVDGRTEPLDECRC